MAVSSELACMLDAFADPAMLIRPTDMTVAAVNAAFAGAFGSFSFEGRKCWEAVHHSGDCAKTRLGCPLAASPERNGECTCFQTIYGAGNERRYVVRMRPIYGVDGAVKYWLERISIERNPHRDAGGGCLIGKSPEHMDLVRQMEVAASSDFPVLLLGPDGIGKETYARSIHENGSRAYGPFVMLRSGMADEKNARSILCGGETEARPLLEISRGGTLYIENLSRQPKPVMDILEEILREGTYRLDGSDERREPASRIICSSTEPVAGETWELLAGFCIRIPALRERRADIAEIARYFARQGGKGGTARISEEALQVLERYDWPGNVRELYGEIQAAKLKSRDGVITPAELGQRVTGVKSAVRDVFLEDIPIVPVDRMRDMYISWAMEKYDGSRGELAKLLDVSERTLYRMAAKAKRNEGSNATDKNKK